MDKITIMTPTLNVVFSGGLIKFIDWRYSHVGIFDPSSLAPVILPPSGLPSLCESVPIQVYVIIQWNGEGGGG
jgi:hypothetical protein